MTVPWRLQLVEIRCENANLPSSRCQGHRRNSGSVSLAPLFQRCTRMGSALGSCRVWVRRLLPKNKSILTDNFGRRRRGVGEEVTKMSGLRVYLPLEGFLDPRPRGFSDPSPGRGFSDPWKSLKDFSKLVWQLTRQTVPNPNH